MRVLDFSFLLCHITNMMFNLLSVILLKLFSLLFCFWSCFHLYAHEVFHAWLWSVWFSISNPDFYRSTEMKYVLCCSFPPCSL
jgi:hypothetical protein